MKSYLQAAGFMLMACVTTMAQNATTVSPFNSDYWGVVLDHPEMKNVKVKPDVPFLEDGKGTLKMDIYFPPDIRENEKRPAVIFLNAMGDSPGQPTAKSRRIYRTWPQLVAAYGMVGISMESDRERNQESIQALFKFLKENGAAVHVDADRLGVYAASAHVPPSATYLMGDKAFPGIKAAVLYYGATPAGPYRKDLPVPKQMSLEMPTVALAGDNEANTPWTVKWH